MRGKDTVHHVFNKCRRITPAYAGKSSLRDPELCFEQDHPRLCGEKFHFIHYLSICSGSPPPMRGKAKLVVFPINVLRITPAYAGKSLGSILIRSHIQDHPRLCGEKYPLACYHLLYIGSPPPMRGKVCGKNVGVYGFGITPAYAGKSYNQSDGV